MIESHTPKSKFRQVLSAIGCAITGLRNIIFLVMVVAVVVIASSLLDSDSLPELTEPGALLFHPKGQLTDERAIVSSVEQLFFEPNVLQVVTFEVIEAIEKAASDPMINSLVIFTDDLEASSISKIEAIGRAINTFKASRKKVIAYGSGFSQGQYLLASYADQIWMHPMGAVQLTGLGMYSNYMKSALDKLNIKVHVYRSGEYKSVADTLTEDAMPASNKEHNQTLIDDVWDSYQKLLISNRSITKELLTQYTHEMDTRLEAFNNSLSDMALGMQLVDKLVTSDQVIEMLEGISGEAESETGSEGFNYISVKHYFKPLGIEAEGPIGLIVASGLIHSGDRSEGGISSRGMRTLLRSVRQRDDIKALIIRVDSGGGSALASEVIRREIALTRKQGIPVIISMGSVAASGGYWIATAADQIWAGNSTVTGSIGVISLFPTLNESFNRIGVHNDGVGTTPIADAFYIERPMNPIIARVLQSSVDSIYNQFINLVAQSRNMEANEVKSIAEGRIWSGQQALKLGLVDAVGGFDEVVDVAAKLANIKDKRVQLIRHKRSFTEELLEQVLADLQIKASARTLSSSVLRHVTPWLKGPLLDASQKWLKLPYDPNKLYLICEQCNLY